MESVFLGSVCWWKVLVMKDILYTDPDLPGWTYPSMWNVTKTREKITIAGKGFFSPDVVILVIIWCTVSAILSPILIKNTTAPLWFLVGLTILTAVGIVGMLGFMRIAHRGKIIFSFNLKSKEVTFPVWSKGRMIRHEILLCDPTKTKAIVSRRIPKEAVRVSVKGIAATNSKYDPWGMQLDIEVSIPGKPEKKKFPIFFEVEINKLKKISR